MDSLIFDPLNEFDGKYRELHKTNTNKFFEQLVKKSGIDVEQNRKIVKLYKQHKENRIKLNKELKNFKVLRVFMCITIVLIPLVVIKTTPKIKQLQDDVENSDKKADELLKEANGQMLPLNSLFTNRDALDIIESTLPLIKFDDCFSVKQETDMVMNYDFGEYNDNEHSTIDVLAGNYNENPFLFENKIIHTMGTQTYHGYRDVTYRKTYLDLDGRLKTKTVTETLHATLVKPKPFYQTQVVLNYCSQNAPDLFFSRNASHLELKTEKEIKKIIKQGEKELKKKNNKAISEKGDFTSMSNTDFEILFNALNRTNEVQFRTLFTPLAQNNFCSLILSKLGYGDDFSFIKSKRTNKIITDHSQGRAIKPLPTDYISYSFDIIKENFISKNIDFFKAVYFDLAPILAIPAYQERPVHSLIPIPEQSQIYSLKECEVLANAVDLKWVIHPNTKTKAILKSRFVKSKNGTDETCITAYSYDIEKRVSIISVRAGNGKHYDVAVEWDEYLPLEMHNKFYITTNENSENKTVIASRNGLCIFKN